MIGLKWHNIRLVIIVLLMVFLYSFSSKRNGSRVLKEVNISFEGGTDNMFITHEMVNNLLKQNLGGSLSIQKDAVDLNTLETVLDDHGMIEKAEVFSTVDGSLNAHIKQKSPTVRFISDNTSYYIDRKGTTMPLSENFSARVPLVVGSYVEKDKGQYLSLFNEISDDDFLSKDITGIKILPSGSILMKSRNYDYTIIFGKPVFIDRKLKNYKAFFYHAIKDTLVKQYKEVNLMFTEQVVCKK
ncbi:cell division protein FtsQ [Flavobacterium sp. NRK F10]|uniref:cell division protein FtsQ/DivIB n=1 Tax=Flavobacterium sp. NRK F10 TaxID=2954931 RepID=UPI0020904439|nr:cell division protein FtsQ [Flavobacterium sp. NRK F10]MCO6175288.1 cell division protein FtsQ [Flavobacterium sp. NRK F10]